MRYSHLHSSDLTPSKSRRFTTSSMNQSPSWCVQAWRRCIFAALSWTLTTSASQAIAQSTKAEERIANIYLRGLINLGWGLGQYSSNEGAEVNSNEADESTVTLGGSLGMRPHQNLMISGYTHFIFFIGEDRGTYAPNNIVSYGLQTSVLF